LKYALIFFLSQLFGKIDPRRAAEDDSLLEATIAICAIERLLEFDEQAVKASSSSAKVGEENNRKSNHELNAPASQVSICHSF